MRPRARVLAGLLAIAACGVVAPAVEAKPKAKGTTTVEVTSEVNPARVEVGDPFMVTLRLKGDRLDVGSPSLQTPPELTAIGSNLVQHTYIVNGAVSRGVDATWHLRASRPGRFAIPAPSAMVNGKRVTGTAMTVEVVPSTGNKPQTGNPFPMPGMPGQKFNFPWPFGADDLAPDADPPRPASRTDLDMKEDAPDARAFVRAVVDKTSAVIGEQVTVRYYIYCAVSCIPEQSKDPEFGSFRRVALDRGEPDEPIGDAHVHGELFKVKLEARSALFPLTAGDLKIGALQLNVRGRRFSPAGELRVSNVPVIHVTEPPIAGRPPGYAVGDVGVYSITASLQPRKTELGGSVAVNVRVAGTGLVPDAIRVPDRSGVEWLDPEKKEQIDVQAGKVTGWRTFGYVVRLMNAGTIDLGSVQLPYWDPIAKKYQVASAPIGEVEVAGVPADPTAVAEKPSPDELLASLPLPRKTLAPWTPDASSAPLAGARFWGLLAAPPVGLALLGAAARARRKLAARRALGATSARAVAERALAQANAATGARDVAAAVERAAHAGIEAAYGVRSRGLLLDELPATLRGAGATEARADALRDLLAACDAARFVPGEAEEASARDLAARARELVPAMLRESRAS